jgi:uncharacterized protein (DUF342 family)
MGMPENPNTQPAAAPVAPSASVDAYLDLKAEAARVTLLVRSSVVKDGVNVTKEDVATKLQAAKVIHEVVDWNVVESILTNKLYDRTHVIATAIQAKPGKDAYVEEKVKIDPDVKPVVGEDGKADYKNVDNIHHVKKGDVLAVVHPAVPGIPGQDCFGKLTTVPAVKHIQLKVGSNTEVTPDGLQLLASTGGYVYHLSGAICVGVTFVLKGDVDFTTGNLKYDGDITIQGSVTDGFIVESQGDITVEGNVDASQIISRGGSVTVKQGVFGHGKGRIIAHKNIHLQSAQDIRLECGETLIVDKGLRNCQVIANDVKADKPGCVTLGGNIKAYDSVALAVLGGEGTRTEIRMVDKVAEQAKAAIEDLAKRKTLAVSKLEATAKRLKGMKALAEKFGSEISERARADLKAVLDLYAGLNRIIKEGDEQRDSLMKQMNPIGRLQGKFMITEKVSGSGFLDLYGHIRELVEEDAKKEWIWAPDGMLSRSIMPDPAAPKNPKPPQG